MSVLKDHYYRLASDLPNERIEAASALLGELVNVDSKDDWDYAYNRLVKGLVTSRQTARFGFSMALTEVIRELVTRLLDFTVPLYLNLLKEVTTVKSAMKGKEERSVLFGRLFGFQALINSQVLINHTYCNGDIVHQFIQQLLELSNEKSWLRESATFTLCQFIKVLDSDECDLGADLVRNAYIFVLQETNNQKLNLSTEGIAIYLSIPNADSLVKEVTNVNSGWKNGNPFSKGNLPVLAKALKDVEIVDEDEEQKENGNSKKKLQKGTWTPQIPFVWDLIISHFNEFGVGADEDAEDEEMGKKRKKTSSKKSNKMSKTISELVNLKEFWLVVIDQSFFSEKSSHERKYWGFVIFQKFLQSLSRPEQVQYLFTPNLLRCLINQTGQSDRYLNKVAGQTLATIQQVSKKNFLKSPYMLSKLTSKSNGGCWNFDLVSKSKTVDSLISISKTDSSNMNEREIRHTLEKIRDVFVSIFEEVSNQETINETILRWTLDKLLLLVRSNKSLITEMKKGDKFVEGVLQFLISLSYFQKDTEIPANTRKYAQEKLNAILSEVINMKRSDGSSWSLYCVNCIISLEENDKYQPQVEFDDEIKEVKSETICMLDNIKELNSLAKETFKKEQFYCFELMFSMVLLQLYLGDEEAVQVLGELKLCFEDTFINEGDDEDFDASIVLTEIILSLVSRKSALTKKLVNIIWGSFLCETDEKTGKLRISDSNLQFLYDVLIARENKDGQKKLFEGEGEYRAEDEEEENASENHSDDENEDDKDENEEENDEEDEEDDSDDSDSDDSDGDDVSKIDQETNIKLAKALNLPTTESGEVKFSDLSDSDGNGDYESDSMDDEEMMAMDEQLSNIFKERKDALDKVVTGNKRKADVLEAKEQMIFFKNRILDLLETFCKVQPNSHLNLSMISPILTLINLTLDKNLGTKAHKLLKSRISKTKIDAKQLQLYYPTSQEISDYKDKVVALISKIQGDSHATKSSNQSYVLACNQACIILSKNLIGVDESYLEKVIEIYCESLKKWAMSEKSNIQPSLFFDFINWLNTKRENKSSRN
jgi:DNA polymerase phi